MYPGRRLQAGRHRQTKQPAQAERDQAGEQGTQQMSLTGEKLMEPIWSISIEGNNEELAACG